MKKSANVFVVLLVLLLISVGVLAKKGPVVDKIYFDVRMKEEIGLKDVVEGNTDIFLYDLQGTYVNGLDQESLNKLDFYTVPSGSWSLLLNPIPNKAPYTWKVNKKEEFNPFAIRKIRYAMNWLINRQYIVDEILGGAGGPMFTMATPGQPGTYKYGLVASRQGMTTEGDEEKALNIIEEEMKKAANLPHNKGRLKKEGKWWTFDGEPITIKFIIRVDDPEGRLKEGEYIAQQIEKAGIKVERLLWDRVKAMKTTSYHDPAKYEWNIYTEGWGTGETRKWWDQIVCQMYSPWYGYMPGGANPEYWNYKNNKLDQLTKKAYNGLVLTKDEYWDTALEAMDIGLKEAVRIYVAYQNSYYATHKDSFKNRMVYGLGDGLTNQWALSTADTKDGTLRVTQYSAKGGLFMSAWNPVGSDGLSDTYSKNIARILNDEPFFSSPADASATEFRAVTLDNDSKVHKKGEQVVGDIKVSPKAVVYDPAAKKWVTVKDKTAMSRVEYKFHYSDYHHGIPMSIVDFMYADAFTKEWSTEDYKGDPYYDAQYASNINGANISIATVYDLKNDKIICYTDYNFPADKRQVALRSAPNINVYATRTEDFGVSWEIIEALARIVVDGGESGIKYSFSSSEDGGQQEVDVLKPTCVADIKAELQEMIEEDYVPTSIKDYVTVKQAKVRYQAAIDFINKYAHAYISNGALYLAKYDPEASYAELRAFRDETYPFEADYWVEKFKNSYLAIDKVSVPMMVGAGEDIDVKVNASVLTYPVNTAKAAKSGKVKLLLITEDKEVEFKAELTEAGVFKGKIPGKATKGLKAGTYTILAFGSVGNSAPTSKSATIVIY